MTTLQLTFTQKQAIWAFRRKRAAYFEDLSSALRTTNKKMLEIIEADAQRYEHTPRGVLSALWAQRFLENGADLAAAWSGTLPAEEVAVLQVLQNAGQDAIPAALTDLAAMAKLADKVTSEAISTLAVGCIAIAFALCAIFLLPGFSVATLKESIDVPVSYWGKFGQAMADWDLKVKAYSLPTSALCIMTIGWIVWSVKNWTGIGRERADKKITLYRTLRDIAAVRFLSAMATLTRKRAGAQRTLEDALVSLSDASPSPWMRWRVQQVLARIDETGATTCDVFDTGILSQDMFWRLRDVEEGSDFATAFDVTSQHVATQLVPRLIKHLTVWRWIMLLIGVVSTGAMVVWIQLATAEMKTTVMNYMN